MAFTQSTTQGPVRRVVIPTTLFTETYWMESAAVDPMDWLAQLDLTMWHPELWEPVPPYTIHRDKDGHWVITVQDYLLGKSAERLGVSTTYDFPIPFGEDGLPLCPMRLCVR